jgi:hypothetical protein
MPNKQGPALQLRVKDKSVDSQAADESGSPMQDHYSVPWHYKNSFFRHGARPFVGKNSI